MNVTFIEVNNLIFNSLSLLPTTTLIVMCDVMFDVRCAMCDVYTRAKEGGRGEKRERERKRNK